MARLLDEMFEADIETMIALNIAFLVVFAIGPYLRMYARRVELPAACGVFYTGVLVPVSRRCHTIEDSTACSTQSVCGRYKAR